MKQEKKVSIVTATYNDGENLRRIKKQILSQDYQNIEYIIVDGASQDHTMEVIREAESEFGHRLRWISEPDKGIYDALNKGFRMATGDILGCCFDQFAHEQVLSPRRSGLRGGRPGGAQMASGTGQNPLRLDAGPSHLVFETAGL